MNRFSEDGYLKVLLEVPQDMVLLCIVTDLRNLTTGIQMEVSLLQDDTEEPLSPRERVESIFTIDRKVNEIRNIANAAAKYHEIQRRSSQP
jgi:hypothetical protein